MAYEPMQSVKEFHDAVGQKRFIELNEEDRNDLLAFRTGLIAEEFAEVASELGFEYDMESPFPMAEDEGRGRDLHRLAKELADLLYVIYGTAEVLEIPLEDVFDKVHANNMTKFGADGTVIRRPDGKILKPPNYQHLDPATLF